MLGSEEKSERLVPKDEPMEISLKADNIQLPQLADSIPFKKHRSALPENTENESKENITPSAIKELGIQCNTKVKSYVATMLQTDFSLLNPPIIKEQAV